jgi:hypothetical protein
MKSKIASALVLIGLAAAPLAATTSDDGDTVSYEDALQCSALYSVLAGASEGSDTAILEAEATRWLVYSMGRDGTEDGSKASDDMIVMVDDLIAELDDTVEGEEFLYLGIDFCAEKRELVADELDAIELE